MSGIQLLLSFIVATIGWQLIAEAAGPPLAQKFYGNRVARLQAQGITFSDRQSMEAWAERVSRNSMNIALLLLAALCGSVAGMLNFPLVGFSRSTNGWSWLRILTLCGTSWLVASMLYPSSY